MTEETIKRSSFKELSEMYDRVFKDEESGNMFDSYHNMFDSYHNMFDSYHNMFDFDGVAPYSIGQTPAPWRESNSVKIKY